MTWVTRKRLNRKNWDFQYGFTEILLAVFFRIFFGMDLNFFRPYNNKLGGTIRTTQKESSRSDLREPNNDRLKFYAQNLIENLNWILESCRFENALCLRIFFNYAGILYVN